MSIPTHIISNFDATTNNEYLSTDLELREEVYDEADLRNEAYKSNVAQYHDRHIRAKAFLPGSLATRKASIMQRDKPRSKLSASFECPDIIKEEIRPGTYRLRL